MDPAQDLHGYELLLFPFGKAGPLCVHVCVRVCAHVCACVCACVRARARLCYKKMLAKAYHTQTQTGKILIDDGRMPKYTVRTLQS